MTATMIEPIQRSVIVNRSVEDAFRIFTDEIGRWWPLESHSIGEDKVATALFEGGAGGRVVERWHDGTEHEWAKILEWEAPNRFVLAWKPNTNRSAPTEVEVRFSPEGNGTRVELTHRGWERLGDEALGARESYAGGWQGTLERFVQATAA